MRVTVVLPACNAEATLEQAVESVLGQTHRDFELRLIDDGSTDGTWRIMEAFARRDPRVHLTAQANMGMGASLNRAIAEAGTEWIARMDADDVMVPTRLERQMAFVERHPGLAVASCFVYYINSRGQVIAAGTSDLLTREDLARYVRANRLVAVSHPGAVLRRDAVLAVGGYRPRFWPAEDIDLWSRLVEAGHGILVQPEYLLKYRIHGRSVCVSRPRLALIKVRWVEECMLARRASRPEPTLEEFLESERRTIWSRRVNRRRKDAAQLLYKLATYYYGEHLHARVLLAASGFVLLAPVHGVRRLWGKVLGRWLF